MSHIHSPWPTCCINHTIIIPIHNRPLQIIGFLNSDSGGVLYFGIADDGSVQGSFLDRGGKDKFRQVGTIFKR